MCVFVFKQTFSGCTLEWELSAVHPLVLMLPSQPSLFPWLFACIHPLVPNDIQTLAWPFSLLVEMGSLADTPSVYLAKFRASVSPIELKRKKKSTKNSQRKQWQTTHPTNKQNKTKNLHIKKHTYRYHWLISVTAADTILNIIWMWRPQVETFMFSFSPFL